ncbi:MAG: DnaJ domain-containing protein [Planctomycetota bacterium]
MREPHRVLGVRIDASADEIRRAYRQLARAHHPDASGNPASAPRFAEIVEAYQRMLGLARERPVRPGPGKTGPAPGSIEPDPDEADAIYDSLFADSRARATMGRGARTPFVRRPGTMDLQIELPISVTEASEGGTVALPGLHAGAAVEVPMRTVAGDSVRLPGLGVRGAGGARGDLIVVFSVVAGSGDPLDLDS